MRPAGGARGAGPADVPDDVLARVRAVCAPLPGVHEEPAWVGTRWRVRSKTFAHVLTTDGVRPAAHVRVAGVTGPALLLVFRAAGMELDVLSRCGPPFFRGNWGTGVIGMVLGTGGGRRDVDWDEVAELLTDSYCVQAPRTLAARVARPGD